MSGKRPAETIQTLLEAESEAKLVVEKARKERDARLKKAASEAEEEIAAYRAAKEAEYQAEVDKYMGTSGTETERIAAETEKRVADTYEATKSRKEEVVSMLISFVTNVDTTVRSTAKK